MENASLPGGGRERGRAVGGSCMDPAAEQIHTAAHTGPQRPLVDLPVANGLEGPLVDNRGLVLSQ